MMKGIKASSARFTAVPIAPEEESTSSSAGESFSMKRMAPSAPSMGSLRATVEISETASFTRWQASFDERQPKARARNRAANSHLGFEGLLIRSP
ncbi:hypothetical protein D3C87_1798600 [compost metagenome]